MRSFRVLAAAVVTAAALAVPLASATAFPAPAATAATVPATGSIGMNGGGDLMWEPADQLAADLDAMRAAGAGWVRLDIDWSSIEGTKGRQSWSNADRVVDAARSRGLQVLAIATYAPRWAQDASVPAGTTHGRPASAQAFGTFAGQAAAHFAGRISAWEIWNEPNLATFFSPRVDAGFYTSLVKASATAIRAAAPGTTVLAGAMAPAVDSRDGSSTSPVTFLQQMYSAGVQPFMDAVSVHPYSFPALPSDPATANWNTFYRLRNVHDLMVSKGDAGKKIWLTEFGAPTGLGDDAVSEQQQASIIADGLATARALSYAGPTFLYEIRDARSGTADLEENFGLLRTDRSAKPAYAAVSRAARDASSAPATPDAPVTSAPVTSVPATPNAPVTSAPVTPPAPGTSTPAPTAPEVQPAVPPVDFFSSVWGWLLALLTTWFR